MEVTVEGQLSRLHGLSYHLLAGQNFGEIPHVGSDPLSVEVLPGQAASVVAYNHSIRVEHRHNLEYITISELFGPLFIPTQQVFDDSLNNV